MAHPHTPSRIGRLGRAALAAVFAASALAACASSDDAATPVDPATSPGQEVSDPGGETATPPTQPASSTEPDVPPASPDADDAGPSVSLGDWLGAGLSDGNHANMAADGAEVPDVGLTIDVGWALAALGGHDAELAQIGQWIADPVQLDAYTGVAEGSIYVAATAKAALALMSDGMAGSLDPNERHVRMQEQLGRLAERRQEDGRLSDESSYGDYSGPYGQALAVIALGRAEDAGAAAAADYLAAAACSEGGFPMMFSAPGDTEESDPECVTDIDTTAMAVQALAMAGGHDAEVDTHVTWLAGLQNPDGWWGLEGPSVNTTGVVVSALASLRARGTLGEGPVDAAIEAGAQWLANVQNADGGFPLGSAGGSDLRASAQAALGLARVGVADLVD